MKKGVDQYIPKPQIVLINNSSFAQRTTWFLPTSPRLKMSTFLAHVLIAEEVVFPELFIGSIVSTSVVQLKRNRELSGQFQAKYYTQ